MVTEGTAIKGTIKLHICLSLTSADFKLVKLSLTRLIWLLYWEQRGCPGATFLRGIAPSDLSKAAENACLKLQLWAWGLRHKKMTFGAGFARPAVRGEGLVSA